MGEELSRKWDHPSLRRANCNPKKYLSKKKALVSGLSMSVEISDSLSALLLETKSMRPRPPCERGTEGVFRAIVSILEPHRKEKIILLNRETTHSGVGRTLERNQNLLAPRTLMIRTLPTKDSARDFQRFKLASSLESRSSKYYRSLDLRCLNTVFAGFS